MIINTIDQIVNLLTKTNKFGYNLEFANNEYKIEIEINSIDSPNSAQISITSLDDSYGVSSVYNGTEILKQFNGVYFKPKKFRQYSLNRFNEVIRDIVIVPYNDADMVNAIISNSAYQYVILLSYDGGVKPCYFVGGRTFIVNQSENFYELVENDLSKIMRDLPNSKIVLLDVMKRYNVKSFFTEHNAIADKLNKKFTNLKNGVRVR